MRERGLATIRDLSTRGLLRWELGGARFDVPPDMLPVVRQDRRTIEAVLRRASVFSRQLSTAGPDPFVRLRDPKWTAEGCPSCGAAIGEDELRCGLCALAAELALEGRP